MRLAELLGEADNDAFRPTDVSEPVRIPVLHLADEFGAMGLHARNDSVDVVDGKHDATEAQRVHWRVHGPKPDCAWRVELIQLNALPIGGPHHCECGSD